MEQVAQAQRLACECGASFSDRRSLTRHKRTACARVPVGERAIRRDNLKVTVCLECGAPMLARSLAKHRNLKHPTKH